jgi:hypothetical protein
VKKRGKKAKKMKMGDFEQALSDAECGRFCKNIAGYAEAKVEGAAWTHIAPAARLRGGLC